MGIFTGHLVIDAFLDNAYYFLEKWQDKAGLDLHMQQQYFVDTIAAVGKISEGDLEIHLYETV